MSFFAKKNLSQLLESDSSYGKGLKRTLGAGSIAAFGFGAISGAGVFMRTSSAIAYHAGPGVIIAFILAAIACIMAALCYAELASAIPVAGSTYAYTYATMGELVAWIVGWDLVLEYAVGASAVAIGWSEYFNHIIATIGFSISYCWSHSPFQVDPITHARGIVNLPALGVISFITLTLIRGNQESAMVAGFGTILKFIAILLFICIGWRYTHPIPFSELIPEAQTITEEGIKTHYGGLHGILGAAGIVFFAFIGFDAISTTSQEAKNPGRDLPRAILGAVGTWAVLFALFAFVLVCVTSVEDLRKTGHEATVARAIEQMSHGANSYSWLSIFLTIAALIGFTSSILIMSFGQSRILFALSRDGLLPLWISSTHPRYHTPVRASLIGFLICSLFAGFVPIDIVGEITSIGTLFSFMLVCVCT